MAGYHDYAEDFEFVQKNTIHKLGVAGQEFAVSPHYDRVDFFEYLGAWAVMIINEEPGGITMVWTDEENINPLLDMTNLGVNDRPTITEDEYASYLNWMGSKLTDEGMGIEDIDIEDIGNEEDFKDGNE